MVSAPSVSSPTHLALLPGFCGRPTSLPATAQLLAAQAEWVDVVDSGLFLLPAQCPLVLFVVCNHYRFQEQQGVEVQDHTRSRAVFSSLLSAG